MSRNNYTCNYGTSLCGTKERYRNFIEKFQIIEGKGGGGGGGHGGHGYHNSGRYLYGNYAGNSGGDWGYYPYDSCGCQVTTDPKNMNTGEHCIPGGDRTCYCKDTCSDNPQWWNCASIKNGGMGVPPGSSCGI